jgi:transposase
MKRKVYSSDVTDMEWSIIEPFIENYKSDAPAVKYDLREIVNGIFYILRNGNSWRNLPHDLPKWSSVYGYFRMWTRDGVIERINIEMQKELRKKLGKNENPSITLIDSQSVKTTEKGGFVDLTQVRT